MAYKIMLDAGHYGYYNQSPNVPEYWESKQMWRLHLYLKDELLKYGFTVEVTREVQEKDLAVVKRGEMAQGCDLFISLHSNAVGGSGGESVDRVDIYSAYDDLNDSSELATVFLKAIAECMGVSEGKAKTRKSTKGEYEYYGVLRGARSVGCPLYYIIEHSFHTNPYAARWLLDDANLARLARVEAAVIATYFGLKGDFEKGDVNMDGRLDSIDVMLIKRAYFGTLKLSEEQKKLADIDENGEIDVFDYIAAKRRYFGN